MADSPLDAPARRPFRKTPPAAIAAAALIVLIALGLRLAHNRSGVPHAVGVDEPQVMERAVAMMKTGDFNPHFFDWPSLTIYIQFLVSCAAFLAGSMRGAWNNLSQVGAAEFYVAGRSVTAVLGAGTVLVLWLAARRWGTAVGLIAAGFLAVMPNHVRESHFTLTDVPTAFFTTLALLTALRAWEKPTRGAFLWAGLVAGLAGSSKYNGFVAIMMPLTVAITAGPTGTHGRLRAAGERIALTVAAAIGGFLLGTPYALLDLPKFLNDYARLAFVFAQPRGGEPGWSLYLKYIRGSIGWPGMLLGALGAGLAAVRVAMGPDRVKWLLMLVFPVVYFTVMARSFQIYGRYTLPLLPLAGLLAALGATTLVAALPRRVTARARGAVLALTVVLTLGGPLMGSIDWLQGMATTSTTDRAYAWIEEHIPHGTRIAIETGVMMLPPNHYPSLVLRSLVDRTYEQFVEQDFSYVVANGVAYGAAFADPDAHRERYEAYTALFARADEVARFDEQPDRPGPTLRIFKLRR